MADHIYAITCARCMVVFINYVRPGKFATSRDQAEAIARKHGARKDKDGCLICATCVDAVVREDLLEEGDSLVVCRRCALPKKEGEIWSTYRGYEICSQCNRDLTAQLVGTFEREDPSSWAPLKTIKSVIQKSKTVTSNNVIKGPRRKIELD